MEHLSKHVKKIVAEQAAISGGVRALLIGRISQACNHWIQVGHCPIDALDNGLSMHRDHQAIGGSPSIDLLTKATRRGGRVAYFFSASQYAQR